MNSINKNQPEENHEDLIADKAINKVQDLAKSAKTCFFCTTPSSSESKGTRPMTVKKVDDAGCFWFVSAKDSNQDADIQINPEVKLYFQGSAHSDFMYLEGTATITYDKAIIDELWEPMFKVWFTEGKDDPRISIIKITPTVGYYWDNKNGNAIAAIKMLAGAITGQTLDDSIEGNISI
jgi:general stress protein 26